MKRLLLELAAALLFAWFATSVDSALLASSGVNEEGLPARAHVAESQQDNDSTSCRPERVDGIDERNANE